MGFVVCKVMFSLTVCGIQNAILLSDIFLLWESHAVNPKGMTRHSINSDHVNTVHESRWLH
jgi:hypothetical protein